MLYQSQKAKVNVKVLCIILGVVVVLCVSLVAARHIRRRILSQLDYQAAELAYENKEWSKAFEHYAEYLGRNTDDVAVLKKYAHAGISIRPLETNTLFKAIGVYRRVLQLTSDDLSVYDSLGKIYQRTGQLSDLAYIARKKLDLVPNNPKAVLWLADALVGQGKPDEAKEILSAFIESQKKQSEKLDEFIEASSGLSELVLQEGTTEARYRALELLSQAVRYDPQSANARLYRARFYRQNGSTLDTDVSEKTRADLETAQHLGLSTPRLKLELGFEWLAIRALDQVQQVFESLPEEVIDDDYWTSEEWTSARYGLASQLALHQQDAQQVVDLTDAILEKVVDQRYRERILAIAVNNYLMAGEKAKARLYLDEYVDYVYTQQVNSKVKEQITFLEARVANAEGHYNVVIDLLQPMTVSDAWRPEFWRILANAYVQNERPKQAIAALNQYLRIYPRDNATALQLAKQHQRLKQWDKVLEIVRPMASFSAKNPYVALLRIEALINLTHTQKDKVRQEQWAALSKELTELQAANPTNLDIRLLQVLLSLQQNKIDQAEQQLKQAIEACPNSWRAALQLTKLYQRTQRLDEAIKVGRDACNRYGEQAQPWLVLMACHVSNQDIAAARQCLMQGINTVQNVAEKQKLTLKHAQLELQQGDRSIGISILKTMVTNNEQNIDVLRLLLETREIQEDVNESKTLITSLRKSEGETGLYWRYHQAQQWLMSKQWRTKQQDIQELLQYCIDANPRWRFPSLALIEMYHRLNDEAKVEQLCRKILAENPQAIEISERLMVMYEKQGRFSDAEKIVKTLDDKSPLSSKWKIRMTLRKGQLNQAINELKQSIEINKEDVNSLILLARLIYRNTADVQQAMAYLNQAEKIQPDLTAVVWARAMILGAEQRQQEAMDILNAHVDRSPSFNAYALRARYAATIGQHAQAEKDFKTLLTFTERQDQGCHLLSGYYFKQKQVDKAIAVLQERLTTTDQPNEQLQRSLMKLWLMQPSGPQRNKGLALLEVLETQQPDDAELLRIRAGQLLSENSPETRKMAKNKLQQVVSFDPTDVASHILLINMALQEQDTKKAKSLAVQAIGASPMNQNSLPLMSIRAKLELMLDNQTLSVELARLVLEKKPEDPKVLTTLVQIGAATKNTSLLEGVSVLVESYLAHEKPNELYYIIQKNTLVAQEKPNLAISKLLAYCQSHEGRTSLVATLELTTLYLQNNQLDLAEKRIQHAMELSSESPMLINLRIEWATHLFQDGQTERSKDAFESLLKQFPHHIQLINNYAWLLQEYYQRYAEALEKVNRGLEMHPDHENLLDTRAVILSKMPGRLHEAKADFVRLAKIAAPDSLRQAKTLVKLGRLCARLKEVNQAKQHLRHTLNINREKHYFTAEEQSEIEALIKSY